MSLEELWTSTLREIEGKISRANFATWLKDSKVVDRDGGVLVIGVSHSFAKEWVQDKYQKDLLGTIRSFDPTVRKLEFLVVNDGVELKRKSVPAVRQRAAAPENAMDLEFKIDPVTGLNGKYTLDTFVVGPSNELAHAAAVAIVNTPGTKYNPFFVYGGVGLGKTHLIQAIGNAITEKYAGKFRARYVSSERFTSDVVWAIRNKRMEDIKRRYRDTDILIIDDIQFIGGKAKTEEEFFHTFNALYENNKQIIISSDRPPGSIPTLEERLRSRFEGGLIADIVSPEYEMRAAVIRRKLEEHNVQLTDEIVDLIARRVKKNIREIEGVLTKVLFQQEKKQLTLSKRAVEEIIEKSMQNFARSVSDMQILGAVSEFYNVQLADMIGRCRRKEVVEPRQIAMYLLRDLLQLSYPYIGEKMGRDHTTAIHSYEKINLEINKNAMLNQKVFQIKEIISRG